MEDKNQWLAFLKGQEVQLRSVKSSLLSKQAIDYFRREKNRTYDHAIQAVTDAINMLDVIYRRYRDEKDAEQPVEPSNSPSDMCVQDIMLLYERALITDKEARELLHLRCNQREDS